MCRAIVKRSNLLKNSLKTLFEAIKLFNYNIALYISFKLIDSYILQCVCILYNYLVI